MILRRHNRQILLISILTLGLSLAAAAKDGISADISLDLYSRYIWRGLEIGNAPSAQPTLMISYSGFEFGAWGAYTLSNRAFEADEIDFWLSYTHALGKEGASITAIAKDYYFPNAGIEFSNFSDSDAAEPGAHTLELGLSVSGPESFPLTLSGYVNVYNDTGSNTYFEVAYPFSVNNTNLDLFCGIAGGSRDNPDYYGTDKIAVINLGVSAVREIRISESFSIPLTVSLIVNPRADITHLIVGVSF
jgi:hypothetical protein